MDKSQITMAIGAHGMWKSRLKSAIASGSSEFKAATAGRDDTCEFGKWLRSIPPAEQNGPWPQVVEAHRAFHRAVGEVLGKVEAGNKAAAEQLMAPGSTFASTSAACTKAMMEWAKQVS